MNNGRAMPSRESHEVRHIAIARQARSGWPRWNSEAMAPAPVNTSAMSEPKAKKARSPLSSIKRSAWATSAA